VLLETGEQPLWVRWLRRAARLWNRLVAEPAGSLLRRAFQASLQLAVEAPPGLRLAEQSWAGQLAIALGHIGMPVNLRDPRPLSLKPLQQRALAHHLGEVRTAAAQPRATKLAHYVGIVLGGRLPPPEEYAPAGYLRAVRQRARRAALAQLRTGSHWLREETGRWEGVPREQRMCPHCQGGVEGVQHVLFECPLYASARASFPDLFPVDAQPEVASFLRQSQGLVSAFVSECQRRHAVAAAAGVEEAPLT
jgi:hypothetical protein